jgi:glycosyltransferase involved in cell wall biosynthesis
MKRLDIIIPVFNLENYYQSFLKLFVNLVESGASRLIVVNDGSTDNTSTLLRAVVSKYQARVYLVESDRNHGQGNARNIGYSHSTAEYVLFIDADDQISSSQYIDVPLRYVSVNDCDVLLLPFASKDLKSGQIDRMNGRNHAIDSYVPHVAVDRIKLLLLDRISVSPCNKIVSRKLLESIQTEDDQEVFPPCLSCEDIVYTYRLMKYASRIDMVSMDEYYIYQIRDGSTMVSLSERTYDIFYIFEHLRFDIKNTFDVDFSSALLNFFIRECIVNVQRKVCLSPKVSVSLLLEYCNKLESELRLTVKDWPVVNAISPIIANKFSFAGISLLIRIVYRLVFSQRRWI